ncbi:C40 family peptidase [Cohnella sp. GbtcB17]|uniref:C40 family peptidase n=1 Tax=Cohnella sp. GbtcB17 TaxID=2824762 RepID=UPI001C30A58C|nr:C40 family peptidase [Cohnella sp. GbtcB17]
MKKKAGLLLLGAAILFAGTDNTSYASEKPELAQAIDEVIGTPYKWGGTTTSGFDCSGFIRYIFDQFQLELPRTSSAQALAGTQVDQDELLPGDLVFFNTSGAGISHAGIYVGEGAFAHSSSNKGVTISKLSEAYYAKRYVTARRITTEKFL